MSSDQNLDHHTNGLMPEPEPLIWIRAPAREQGAASGVAAQNARFAADPGVSARQVQGPAAGEPGQHATQEGGGQEREGGFDWSNGLNLAGIRSAPQAGGDTPVRTPQQRIAHLRAQIEREEQVIISKSDGIHMPGDELSSLPPIIHQSGSQSTSPFHISNSVSPIQNMAGPQLQFSRGPAPTAGRGTVGLSPASKVGQERLHAQIFKGAKQSPHTPSRLQFQQEVAASQRMFQQKLAEMEAFEVALQLQEAESAKLRAVLLQSQEERELTERLKIIQSEREMREMR